LVIGLSLLLRDAAFAGIPEPFFPHAMVEIRSSLPATLSPTTHVPLLLKRSLPLKPFLSLPLLFPFLVLERGNLALKLL
jgi:hypothetical protein